MRNYFFLLFSILLLVGCTKVAGKGGTSTIKGVINIQDYNATGTSIVAEYPGADKTIYIIYGDGSTYYDDDIKTSYDGTFEFRFLQKGFYTVYTYEDCNTCDSGKKVILLTAEVKENRAVVDLGSIDVKKIN